MGEDCQWLSPHFSFLVSISASHVLFLRTWMEIEDLKQELVVDIATINRFHLLNVRS